MKLKAIDEIPSKRTERKRLQRFIEDFYFGPITIAEIEFTEHDYKNAKSCYSSFASAIKKSGYPVRAILRDDHVYIARMFKGGSK